MRDVFHRLEMAATLDERGARLLQVAEAEVHVTDAEERRPLIVAIVPRPAFREHAIQGVERRAIVALRHEDASQPFEGVGLSAGVQVLRLMSRLRV